MLMKCERQIRSKEKCDIHVNPENPGKSRIPICTALPEIERFIKNEIIVTKTCNCSKCNYRRIMFRAIQQILIEYKKLKKDKCKCS